MNRIVQCAAVLHAATPVTILAETAGNWSFDRYRVIIDRKPFGELKAPEIPMAVQPPTESFAKSLRLSMIVDVNDGESMKVGFVDTRTGKSYLLMPGESQDGIELVSASWKDEEAVLRQGSEMALIKLASGEVRQIGPGAPAPAPSAPTSQRPTWEERRRARAAPPPPPEPPKPKFTPEELERHLQEYQLEVIRQGLPPLPIPLTPEMDARLVAEGILPPR